MYATVAKSVDSWLLFLLPVVVKQLWEGSEEDKQQLQKYLIQQLRLDFEVTVLTAAIALVAIL